MPSKKLGFERADGSYQHNELSVIVRAAGSEPPQVTVARYDGRVPKFQYSATTIVMGGGIGDGQTVIEITLRFESELPEGAIVTLNIFQEDAVHPDQWEIGPVIG
jgi:hypothetical protein